MKSLVYVCLLALAITACNDKKSTSAPKSDAKVAPGGASAIDENHDEAVEDFADMPIESYPGILLEKAPQDSVIEVWRANDINYSIDGISTIQVDKYGKAVSAHGSQQTFDVEQITFQKTLESEIFETNNAANETYSYSEYLYLANGNLINDAFPRSDDNHLYEHALAKLMKVIPESVVKIKSRAQDVHLKYPFTSYCQIGSNFVDIKDAKAGQKVVIGTQGQTYKLQNAKVFRYAPKESPEAQVLAVEVHYSAADKDASISWSSRNVNTMLSSLSVNCYMPVEESLSKEDLIPILNELLKGVATVQ